MSKLSNKNKIVVTESEIQKYYELMEKKKAIEKQLKELNKNFQLYFDTTVGETEKGELILGDYKLQRQIRHSHSFHDEKTVLRLEQLNLRDCIQVIKKPDKEKIHSALTLGMLNESEIADCRLNKTTKAILVKKI